LQKMDGKGCRQMAITKSGFTLIELTVVLAVIGTVLFITLPKFRELTSGDDSERQLNIVLNTIRDLKKSSISDGMDYTLHLDAARSVMWVTSSGMDPELMDKAEKRAIGLPESLRLTDVEIYGVSTPQTQDEYQLHFSHHGYCDMALIHLKEQQSAEELTVVIEPFLSCTEVRRRYISFEQCI